MAAANGDRDRVLQKSRDLKFLTGFETKVRLGGRSGGTADLWGVVETWGLPNYSGYLGKWAPLQHQWG